MKGIIISKKYNRKIIIFLHFTQCPTRLFISCHNTVLFYSYRFIFRTRRIKLAANHQERELYENYAELYSIIKTVEYLEKAYVRDSCTAEEYDFIIFPFPNKILKLTFRYTPACNHLILQFKTLMNFMGPSFDLNKFVADYRVC